MTKNDNLERSLSDARAIALSNWYVLHALLRQLQARGAVDLSAVISTAVDELTDEGEGREEGQAATFSEARRLSVLHLLE